LQAAAHWSDDATAERLAHFYRQTLASHAANGQIAQPAVQAEQPAAGK